MAVIWEFDPATSDALARALGQACTLYDDAADVVSHLATHPETLVVVGPNVDQAAATRFTQSATSEQPGLGVIWLRHRIETAAVLEAVRHGAADVVSSTDLPEFVAAAGRVFDKHNASRLTTPTGHHRAQLSLVFSPKGGSGKTTIATNLAASLARDAHQNTAIVDLDLMAGDVALLLGLTPHRTISDLIDIQDSLDATGINSALMRHETGVVVLAAPQRPEDAEAVSPRLVETVLKTCLNMFDHVVVDCPPTLDENVLAAMELSDEMFIVCTPDIASIKNTAIALRTIKELRMARHLRIVFNRADEPVGIRAADLAEVLGESVDVSIPASIDVPKTSNAGQLMMVDHPKHKVCQAIRTLAGIDAAMAVAEVREAPAASAEPGRATVRKRRLFARRVPAQ